MNNKLKKILNRLKKIFIILFVVVIIFVLGTTFWNKVECIKEDKSLNTIGSNVKVNGSNIRVSITGEGKNTILLLSGMGTPSPIVDFKPLSEKLNKDFKVVTIEYLGYGLSDDSNLNMTNEAIVEEVRSTLKEVNIKPPYILMPHSISGIYCMKYMNMYPEEVQAMIGIDTSIPNQMKLESESAPEVSDMLYYFARFGDITGLSRFSYLFENSFIEDMKKSGSYSNEDIENVSALYNRTSITKARLSEIRNLSNNFSSLYDEKCPSNIPILFILSSESCDSYKKQDGEDVWKNLHEEVISNTNIQKTAYLEGNHYLHWTQSNKIAEMTEEFINENIK